MRVLSGWVSRWQVRLVLVLIAVAVPASFARGALPNPLTDINLLALNLGGGQTPAKAPVQDNEPPMVVPPRAVCGAGSHPLDGVQGRVPASALQSPAGAHGYWCNLTLIAHQGKSGGFKVLRYVDTHGHECAFYDTALLYPLNALQLNSSGDGVAVLDMSDPAHPVQTDTLTSLPMLSPHESLSLNPRRGLLGAVLGNPATYPGLVSIYDASQDCRHPVLDSTALVARFGHEGNFSADGKTFYAAGTGVQSVTAIDVTDPKNPKPIWQGNVYSHGLTLSDDGNRAYIADPIDGQLAILDTSQIQARKPNPQVSEVSRLTWKTATIPQNAIPMTIHGHPYILEFDEYAFRFNSAAPPDTVGAARIIDIADERHPRVVSNIRLAVNQPAEHHAAANDPGASSPVQGYAAHYCNIPQEVDPGIVACSFIASGLRVFDIHDPLHPKEIAYYIAPPTNKFENLMNGSNFAMSKPAFAPARREVWYTDGTSGFYVLRLSPSVWPDAAGAPPVAGSRPSGPGSGPSGPGSRPSGVGCPAAGRLAGGRLGPVWLGEMRSRIPRSVCLKTDRIRLAFASRRIVAAVSASRRYSLHGVRPGMRLRTARRHARLHRSYRVGSATWYVVGSGGTRGLVKVVRGRVAEVGVGKARSIRSRSGARRVLSRL
jgi:hypothetical protein